MGKKIDLTGQEFYRVKVISEGGRDKHGQVRWNCLCSCGKEFTTNSANLRNGHTKSCGCLTREKIGKVNFFHGLSGTPMHKTWSGMISRCYVTSHTSYPRYGAVGVFVCDHWREPDGQGFLNFMEDMGERPDGYQINRKGAAKEYSKENCEWVNLSLQAYDKGMSVVNTSGRTGVNFDIDCQLWTAQLNKEGKVYKKRFASFEAACQYREALELEHFGFTKE